MNTRSFAYSEIVNLVHRGHCVAFAPVRRGDGTPRLAWVAFPPGPMITKVPAGSKAHAGYGLGVVIELRKHAALAGLIPA